MKVWLVWGYDVGGNTGAVVMEVFSNEAAARGYATTSLNRKNNRTTFDDDGGDFDVEECDVLDAMPVETHTR